VLGDVGHLPLLPSSRVRDASVPPSIPRSILFGGMR
jgi:hypothetical protein